MATKLGTPTSKPKAVPDGKRLTFDQGRPAKTGGNIPAIKTATVD